MKHIIIFCFALFFVQYIAVAQTASDAARDSFESLSRAQGTSVMVFNNAYDGIRGTPYLSESWFKGSVVMLTNSVFNEIEMKYDMLEDNVLIKDKTGKQILPTYGSVKSFYYTDNEGKEHKFLSLAPTYGKALLEYGGFYKLLYDGEMKLFVKREKYLKHIDSKGAYSSNRSYDEFREHPPEYLLLVDGKNSVIEFSRGKKSVLTSLGNDENLKNYAKINKLNLKVDEDIIKLIIYFDSIQ